MTAHNATTRLDSLDETVEVDSKNREVIVTVGHIRYHYWGSSRVSWYTTYTKPLHERLNPVPFLPLVPVNAIITTTPGSRFD